MREIAGALGTGRFAGLAAAVIGSASPAEWQSEWGWSGVRMLHHRMGISANTVKAFLRLVMGKMKVSTRSGIVGKIAAQGAGSTPVIRQPFEADIENRRREYLEA